MDWISKIFRRGGVRRSQPRSDFFLDPRLQGWSSMIDRASKLSSTKHAFVQECDKLKCDLPFRRCNILIVSLKLS